jgi:tRNA modification GTPase
VAIATARGESAIGVVRLSGSEAIAIARTVMRDSAVLEHAPSHTLRRVSLIDPRSGEPLDEALCAVMRGPRSYTGEDVVEISCHGSPALLRVVLDILHGRGARLAEPGEFTRRAFLNGRIDLTRAEAVALLVGARTERAVKVAARALAGALAQRIEGIRDALLDVVAGLEVALDFPDDEVGIGPEHACGVVRRLIEMVDEVLALTDRAQAIHRGVTVALVGAPNAGKSTLLNALLGSDRAIVSPVPGTTRDVVEGTIALAGIPVVLRDTAGLGPTADVIEAEGVRRSLKAIEDSDLLLTVVDASAAPDAEVLSVTGGRARLLVRAKMDLPSHRDALALADAIDVSAKTGLGISALVERIAEWITRRVNGDDDDTFVISLRQHDLMRSLRSALTQSAVAIATAPTEAALVDLREALALVAELLGQEVGDAVLDRIFATFCVGK